MHIVTGAAGFLGSNLVRRLLADGETVLAWVRQDTNTWRLPVGHPGLQIVRAPLRRDILPVDSAGGSFFHLAATGVNQTIGDTAEMIQTNVHGTLAALEAALRLSVRRFVYVGSSGEYGQCLLAREDQLPSPNAEYGATKVAGWSLAHAFGRRTGLPVVSVRPFSVFGPYESSYRLVPYCLLNAIDRKPLLVSAGTQTRDYVFVDDVIEGMLLASTAPDAPGATFNLCTGVSTTVREMVQKAVRVTGNPVHVEFGTRLPLPNEMWTTSGDPSRAAAVLGWQPRLTIDAGLDLMHTWLKAHRSDYEEYA